MPTPEWDAREELLSAMVGFGASADSDAWREFERIARAAAQADPDVARSWAAAADRTPSALRQLAFFLSEFALREPATGRALDAWTRRYAPPPGPPARPAPRHTNTLDGSAHVQGQSVQARDIQGGIHIHHQAAPAVPRPRQLPPVRDRLVGREGDLHVLDRLRSGRCAGARSLVVVSGFAGVGKTTLVSRWLQGHADDFPDGQLYADLGGHGTGEAESAGWPPGAAAGPPALHGGPVPTAAVLEAFLQALGVSSVPAETSQRVALWRSVTAGRRLAVMLDNAFTAAQVRPLLVGTPGSLTVVTSRNHLTGLVVDGAAVHRLTALSTESAVELLAAGGGGARVEQAPDAARQVVTLCACLPLAVCLAAAQLAIRPHRTLSALADSLSADQGPLDALQLDGDSVVRTALDTAYRVLPGDAAALYRTLGLLPTDRYDLHLLSAVRADPGGRTDAALSALVEAHLIEETGPGTYRCHDLVRAHARRRGEDEEPAARREALLDRFVDWCLGTARTAERLLTPSHRPVAGDLAVPDTVPAPLDDAAGALDWLDAHRSALMGAVRHCARTGRHTRCWMLVDALWPLFLRLRPTESWIEVHRLGLAAARSDGHREAEDRMLTSGAIGLRDAGHHEEATRWYALALENATAHGDVRQQAQALNGLGHLALRTDRLPQARDHFEQALRLRESLGYRRGAALSRIRLVEAALAADDPDTAVRHLRQAHTELTEEQEHYEAARALALLGHALVRAGEHDAGTARLRAALAGFREAGARSQHWQGRSLEWLGQAAQERGDRVEAARCYTAARDLYAPVSASDTERLTDRLRHL
ncbi:ATP-binding protein [Streptomyces sp. RGM 3693]|uniref:ATP-binding protein n=1 Tax=Streptomyces sp. RGM 3693 TaxID=3413284 RepID=UPI003D279748